MPLALPPKMLINYDDATIQHVYAELTSVIVGHARAVEIYTFYEVVDSWLGPWGEKGYPIGYGKFYAIAFNSNAKLQADAEARGWVNETTRQLQFAMRDYVIERMKGKSLRSITEPEFRAAAFASHAKAYTDGGLTRVVLLAPQLLPVILSIPGKEFNPLSPLFKSTVSQVFETFGLVAARVPGYLLPAIMPAHSGMFRIAAQRDASQSNSYERVRRGLARLSEFIDSEQLDDIATLERVATHLERADFGDSDTASAARFVVIAARRRKVALQQYYLKLTQQAPEVRSKLDSILKNF
jgi:hypothetical protein